ncbi:DNA mismatch repair endonuclease MutH [Oceanimonas sp. CHS3-5]|uniref:DNA mismatch repair endonuclease MutH n=1 Tax=Oceanimonas sp. CHS3-5 TaxID=3068186 RepID=UPI00273FAC18|nr:DNA mismatch repair endonuclease MutH [Oceanimonas sp. CHS3-5]MDP5293045.1 DNA mismatch repair endonuclease MutH [Oceanimonas sp. CHS3-5]
MNNPISRPDSVAALLEHAQQLAGLPLTELARELGLPVPANLRRDKGWIGQLLELTLGASAGSKPEQDFPELGVELKTLPLDSNARPLETTFVCVAPLLDIAGLTWESSNVRNKLSRVLWVPVIGERDTPPGERLIGQPLLWTPSEEEEWLLRQDWEEIMELISLGRVQDITARHGQALQLRPKAANGRALTDAIGPDGGYIQTRPRGFYLKTGFTKALLARHFML